MTPPASGRDADQQAQGSPLGHVSKPSDRYDPTLLFPIPRADQRSQLGLAAHATLPFFGADLWTAFELCWLNPRGKPMLAIAHLTVPCESTHIVESKSLKLYLNGFANTRFPEAHSVRDRIRGDLSEAIWRGEAVRAQIGCSLIAPELFDQQMVHELSGLSLDRLDVECDRYTPAPDLLHAAFGETPVTEVLTSNLLKTNCPVTGQPDWGSVQIGYSGPPIEQGGLLQYLVSFRDHEDFHEHCVERIFLDIQQRCQPFKLTVLARYTRRGGIDINPFRTSQPQTLPRNIRTARQ